MSIDIVENIYTVNEWATRHRNDESPWVQLAVKVYLKYRGQICSYQGRVILKREAIFRDEASTTAYKAKLDSKMLHSHPGLGTAPSVRDIRLMPKKYLASNSARHDPAQIKAASHPNASSRVIGSGVWI
jgi:proteasome lid subunit RPN8/RPN11